jgi:hypothetical protein
VKKLPALLLLTFLPLVSVAEPELKGSSDELRQFLQPQENTVTMYGQAEEKCYADIAVVSLLIATEEHQLAVSTSTGSHLRKTTAQKLEEPCVVPEVAVISIFSIPPMYGWFCDRPSNYKTCNCPASKVHKNQLQRRAALAGSNLTEGLAISPTFNGAKQQRSARRQYA